MANNMTKAPVESYQADVQNDMVVESLYTGEIKRIKAPSITVRLLDISDLPLFDARVKPTQNYSKVDSQITNNQAHKGPDEVQ